MTRVRVTKPISFDRGEVEQIRYILSRLEQFLIHGDDRLTHEVTHYMTNDGSVEWLATWVHELTDNLHQKLFPRQ